MKPSRTLIWDVDVFNMLGKDLRLTWKLHIIFNHIAPFCKNQKTGLGMFAEQTGESIQAKFKSTYVRYTRDQNHQEHGDELVNSVISFDSRRI